MRHAGPDTIAALSELIAALRTVDGLTETRPGAFARRSKAFLHFHEDPSGFYADVRFEIDSNFERVRVTTKREQAELVRRVRAAFGSRPAQRRARPR